MLKPTLRNSIVVGALLVLVAVGAVVFDIVQPAWTVALEGLGGWVRRHLLAISAVVMLLGTVAYARGFWGLAAGMRHKLVIVVLLALIAVGAGAADLFRLTWSFGGAYRAHVLLIGIASVLLGLAVLIRGAWGIAKRPRESIVLGILLVLVAVGASAYDYVQPHPDEEGLFRQHLQLVGVAVMLMGAASFVRGVWGIASGQRGSMGDSDGHLTVWFKRNNRKIVAYGTLIMGVAFGVLAYVSVQLPTPRGSYVLFGPQQAVRVAALVSGVCCVLGILAMLLPLVLNLLEGRDFVSFVAARHVRAAKSGSLTLISVLSISGVAVSSCSLVTVSSIMGGYGDEMQRKILGLSAHVMVDVVNPTGFEDWEPVLERIRQVPGVVATTPVVSGEAMAQSRTNVSGMVVRGIDEASITSVIDLVDNIEVGKFEYLTDPSLLLRLPDGELLALGPGGEEIRKGDNLAGSYFRGTQIPIDPAVQDALRAPPVYPGVILGRELAKSLHAYVGDELTLISPMGDLGPMGVMPRVRKFRVAAIFYCAMYEFDASHAYVLIDAAQDLFSLGTNISSIDIKTANGKRAPELRPVVEDVLQREDLRVRDWQEMNRNLFSALALERLAAFIILSLATIVASFCIVSTLLLMVTEKSKEIAVLKSLGAASQSVLRVFWLEGVVIGVIGTVFGIVAGIALSVGLSQFGFQISPEVYYVDRLPVKVDWVNWLLVGISALAICAVSTIYPAYAASKLRPVESLRSE